MSRRNVARFSFVLRRATGGLEPFEGVPDGFIFLLSDPVENIERRIPQISELFSFESRDFLVDGFPPIIRCHLTIREGLQTAYIFSSLHIIEDMEQFYHPSQRLGQ